MQDGQKRLHVSLQKQKHGVRLTNLKGLEKNSMQAMLVFAAMDLKKLSTGTGENISSSVTNPKETSFVYGLKNPVPAGFFSLRKK